MESNYDIYQRHEREQWAAAMAGGTSYPVDRQDKPLPPLPAEVQASFLTKQAALNNAQPD